MRPWLLVAALLGACGSESQDSPPDSDAALPDAGADPDGAPGEDAGGDGACDPGDLPDDPAVVATDRGPVRGVEGDEAFAFLGIGFAEPPVGALRWQAPEPPACWSEIRDVTSFAPVCAQMRFPRDDPQAAGEPVGDEDCLYLNVWRPKTATVDRPVLVFIHGGGHQQGSASEELAPGVPLYDGAVLASRGDAVVVTIQYRLGPFGYLALPAIAGDDGHAGNWGLLDQIAALEWVQRNVERFGGDPERVLVFGESAGGVSTCALFASPLARGLFSRALIQSGGCVAPALDDREDEALAYADAVGCADGAELGPCLRALSADSLVAPLERVFAGGLVAGGWGPVVDGWALPASPIATIVSGDQAPVPLVIGTNRDETAITIAPGSVGPAEVEALLDRFSEPWRSELAALYPPGESRPEARESFIRATTDAQFICPARRIARAAAGSGLAPVFRYSFDQALANARGAVVGAGHGVELAYLFGAIERTAGYTPTDDDLAVAAAMQDAWTKFAATGDPNVASLAAWPSYEAEADPYWRIAGPSPVADEGLRTEACDVWDAVPPP